MTALVIPDGYFLCLLMICMNKWIWHLLCSDPPRPTSTFIPHVSPSLWTEYWQTSSQSVLQNELQILLTDFSFNAWCFLNSSLAVGGSYISSHIILEYGQLILITMYGNHLLRPKLVFWPSCQDRNTEESCFVRLNSRTVDMYVFEHGDSKLAKFTLRHIIRPGCSEALKSYKSL